LTVSGLLLPLVMLIAGQTTTAANSQPAEVDVAVQAGLAWLADQQAEDGAFGRTTPYGADTAVTALACLALVADGNLPTRGRYARTVQRGLDYVLSQADESGLIAEPGAAVPMYGHGYATLFLAEVFGETDQPQRVEQALRRAVRLIAATQNDEGGWRYQPIRSDADISVTTCQLWALRAARGAGVAVPVETIERGRRYVEGLQNADGGFRYQSPAGESAFARSAAAVSALQVIGGSEEVIGRGLLYLHRQPVGPPSAVPYYYYGHYYAAVAMYGAGGGHWRRWWPAACRELLARQDRDAGRWGDEYETTMALLVLQTPKRLLSLTCRLSNADQADD
jgi:uncharacterized protein YfaS (alpha-2-macroglobulin family)